jgi:two-component system chemotaxis response regulator CheB
MKKKIKVLIVDDSAVVRQTLTSIMESDESIEVLGTASDPIFAVQKINKESPDVITLDIEMPRMDGLTFLRKLMIQHPLPVVIISSLAGPNTDTGIRALESGAVEIIAKPQLGTREFLEESKIRICDAIKAAAQAKIRRKAPASEMMPKFSADAILSISTPVHNQKTTENVIAVGASTGGTEALLAFLQAMPVNTPGIVIVQHMPEHFTKSFANRLNELCSISVKEAENGDTVMRGRALIAPGNHHLLLKQSGTRLYAEVIDGPLVNRHRPSVDVLFRSTAKFAGKNAIGIIMTGMGDDGAKGLLEMKTAGAYTIAQDEKSCVVFGMPNEAIKINAARIILPLDKIAPHICQYESKLNPGNY